MILFVLLILCAAFFGLRLLYSHFWDRGLSCRLAFREEYAVEEDTAALTEVISNYKLLPLPVVEVDFHMDKRLQFADGQNSSVSDRSYRRDVFALSIRQRITRTLEFQCRGRGYFRIETAGITARDLFLTQKYLSSQPQSTEFYVLPRPVPAELAAVPFSRIMGAVLSRKKIYDDPFEFGGLREYSRGDPMKYINWKATARAGELLTNIHESTLSQTVLFLVDMEGLGVQNADRLNEAAVRISCSLCERLLLNGVDVAVYSNGRDALTGGEWQPERQSGLGNLLPLKKRFACLQADNGLPDICQCLPPPTGKGQREEEDLLVLVTRSQRLELLEAFSEGVGKGQGICIVPFQTEHSQVPVPKNVDLVWMEV